MSEKRFKLSSETVLQYQIMDNDTDLNESEVVDLLNKLYEENEQLRQFINKGRRLSVKELMDNTNENELLKKKIRGLEKENEQLLQENNFLKQIREAFQIDVKNSRQMLKGRDSDE